MKTIKTVMHASRGRDVVLLVVAVLILTVPFLNQAYHLDDREFIEFGRVQLDHPFQFYLTDYDYAWHHFEIFSTSHPPLTSSLIAITIWISGGETEWILHSVFLIFPLIAGISMYWLSRRFCRNAVVSALLLMTTMGVLVMSHTLRGDIPGMAMWLAATAAYIWGVDKNSRKLLVLSTILLVLAALTSYQCLSLVPLLFLYALLQRKISWQNLLPLLTMILIFIVYAFYFTVSTGELIRFSYRLGMQFNFESLPVKGRALIAFMGASSIFPLALIVALVKRRWNMALNAAILAALTVIGVVIPYSRGDLTATQSILLVPCLAGGLVIIYFAFEKTITGLRHLREGPGIGSDSLFLSVWLLGVTIYIFLLLPYVAVRYMLPMFPPLVLLFMIGSESLFKAKEKYLPIFYYGTIILTLLLSIPAAIADYRLADLYRSLAEQYKEQFAGAGQKVWFQGEFGFRYYMEKAGFSYLGASSLPKSGDLVIESRVASTTGPDLLVAPIQEEYAVKLDKTDIQDGFPVRIRNPWAETGFYSHRIGPLPVMPSLEKMDEITLYRFQW